MTAHDTETDDEARRASETGDETTDASFLKKHVVGGTVSYLIGVLSIGRALRAFGQNPRRAAFQAAVGGVWIALGTVQRRIYRGRTGEAESTGPEMVEGRDIPFEDESDEDDADGGDETASKDVSDESLGAGSDEAEMAPEEESGGEPPEDRTDADVPGSKIADDTGEATGPSATDAVPEELDETEPGTEDADLGDEEPDVPVETDAEKAVKPDDEEGEDEEAGENEGTQED